MSLIDYQAEPLQTREAMVKRYAAAKARLWGKPPAPTPIVITDAPAEPTLEEAAIIDDDEYAAMLADICPPDERTAHSPQEGQLMTRWQRILRTIAHHYQVSTVDLRGGARTVKLVRPRHVAMFIAVKGLGYSYPQTGNLLGGRDHTTVLHGVRKIRAAMDANPLFASQVADLMRSCGLSSL